MVEEDKRLRYKKTIEEFCLMDDTFMTKFFENNIEDTEYLLRVILNNDKITVEKVQVQYYLKNLQGHSSTIDVLAVDENGNYINVEVQRRPEGAIPKRARYHVDLVDSNHLPAGKDYMDLRETYVIFITESDVLGAGLPIYHVDRFIAETGDCFNDGAHIIYVNGEMRYGDTKLALLMHDFFCIDPNDMNNKRFAKRTGYLKYDQGGVAEMCELMEKLAKEEAEIAAKEKALEIAKNLLAGGMSIEDVAKNTALSIEEVKALCVG